MPKSDSIYYLPLFSLPKILLVKRQNTTTENLALGHSNSYNFELRTLHEEIFSKTGFEIMGE